LAKISDLETMIYEIFGEVNDFGCLQIYFENLWASSDESLSYCELLLVLANKVVFEDWVISYNQLFQTMDFNPVSLSVFTDYKVTIESVGLSCSTDVDQIFKTGRNFRKDLCFVEIAHK